MRRRTECLKDSNEGIHGAAAAALSELSEYAAGSVSQLAECLKDSEESVRYAAAAALGKLGH